MTEPAARPSRPLSSPLPSNQITPGDDQQGVHAGCHTRTARSLRSGPAGCDVLVRHPTGGRHGTVVRPAYRMTSGIPGAAGCSRNAGRAGHRHIVRSILGPAVRSVDGGTMGWRGWNLVGACVVAVSVTGAAAQPPAAPAQPPAATPAKSAPAADPLARDTPRGTVLGFLSAARKGEIAVARQYLDTRADEAAAQALAAATVRGARREAACTPDADQRRSARVARQSSRAPPRSRRCDRGGERRGGGGPRAGGTPRTRSCLAVLEGDLATRSPRSTRK